MRESLKTSHETRKEEHLTVCKQCEVESGSLTTGFGSYQFVHEALPELDLDDIDTRALIFGKELRTPFIISSMTGGIEEGRRINRILAEAAETLGLAMGVGSQRVALLNPDVADTYRVRDLAPDIPLFANLGAVQLNNGYSIDECRTAVDMIDADALILHLNPLQESVQSGGNTNFSGLVKRIEYICAHLEVPVIVKEVGQGISERTASMLRDAGVAAIDIAGAGGTSWAKVESLRENEGGSELGSTFADWGTPTADSLIMARRGAPDVTLIASGGLRTGLDAAKALAMGASFAGYGLPLLKAAVNGIDDVVRYLERLRNELKVAMFCIGAADIEQLKATTALRKTCPECGGIRSP